MSAPWPGRDEGPSTRMEDGAFSLSPKALAGMVSTKSIAEFEALGGLAGLARCLRTDLTTDLGLDETWYATAGSSSRATPTQRQRQDECNHLQARKAVYGTNRLPDRKSRSILDLMILALSDKVLVLLSAVAIISLCLGLYQSFCQPHGPGQPRVEWNDGVAIITAVLIVLVAGALYDYQKERQLPD